MERNHWDSELNWLNRFELALIKHDFDAMDALYDDFPGFEEIEHMKRALALVAQGIEALREEQVRIQSAMKSLSISRSYAEDPKDQGLFNTIH